MNVQQIQIHLGTENEEQRKIESEKKGKDNIKTHINEPFLQVFNLTEILMNDYFDYIHKELSQLAKELDNFYNEDNTEFP